MRTKTERPYCARVARTARDKTGKPDIKGKDLLRYGPNNFNGLGAPCTIGVPSGLNKKAQFDAFRGCADRLRYRRIDELTYGLQAQLSAESSTDTNEFAKLERNLAETASPEILPFIADMWALWEDYFKHYEVHHGIETSNRVLDRTSTMTRSNKASFQAMQECDRKNRRLTVSKTARRFTPAGLFICHARAASPRSFRQVS